MSDLSIIQGQALTMSSREIAELTGKEHFHVMRDLRTLQEQLGAMFGGSIQNWRHPQNGQTYQQYELDKDTCLTLLLGYDAVARMKVIKRWQELEAKVSQPLVPQSLPEALRLAADLAEKKAQAEAALAIAAPKAQALDRIATADGSTCITDAAKVLQIRPKDLFKWLQAHQWIYRRQGGAGWLAYQHRIQQGYLEHKVTTVERSDGTEKVIEAVRVTRKGLVRLSEMVGNSPDSHRLAA